MEKIWVVDGGIFVYIPYVSLKYNDSPPVAIKSNELDCRVLRFQLGRGEGDFGLRKKIYWGERERHIQAFLSLVFVFNYNPPRWVPCHDESSSEHIPISIVHVFHTSHVVCPAERDFFFQIGKKERECHFKYNK